MPTEYIESPIVVKVGKPFSFLHTILRDGEAVDLVNKSVLLSIRHFSQQHLPFDPGLENLVVSEINTDTSQVQYNMTAEKSALLKGGVTLDHIEYYIATFLVVEDNYPSQSVKFGATLSLI